MIVLPLPAAETPHGRPEEPARRPESAARPERVAPSGGTEQAGPRILLVDDHEVVRMGLRALLATAPGFSVVAEADSVATAVAAARRWRPDVVVMDVRLPDGSGVEACREIRAENPNASVIMLTSFADEEAVFASILAGAAGYLLKQARGQALIDAVETVWRGASLLDPAVTRQVLARIRRMGQQELDDDLARLSEQERKILPLIAEGKTNREIAAALFLSDRTVKSYVSNILTKLNLSRRAEAAAFITRHAGHAGMGGDRGEDHSGARDR
ncbi:MAG: response regulator transcription factor [Chloroflexi bacterium]|nr:response regulator transcription factor [Chloroflexota bacterium]